MSWFFGNYLNICNVNIDAELNTFTIRVTKKKLTGLKNGFSSFENKKLKDLKDVRGGVSAASSYRVAPNACGSDCSDTDYYTDDASGNWKFKARLMISGPYYEGYE